MKKNLHSILLWVRLPRLLVEMWKENILRTILKRIGKLCKVEPNSKENFKGLFTRVCLEVDFSKLLKIKTKYIRRGCLINALLTLKTWQHMLWFWKSNIDACSFDTKGMVFQVEKVQEPSQVDNSYDFKVDGKLISQVADWIEVKPKRKQIP